MTVRVKLSGLLSQVTGWQDTLETKGQTPLQCLQELEARFPDIRRWIYDKEGRMWARLQVFVNGKMLQSDDFTRSLQEGDELFLLLNISGG